MNEARLGYVTVGMGVTTVLLCMAPVIAQGATLQQLAAVGEMAMLVAPTTTIRDASIIGDPRLSNKPLTL